MQRLLTRCLAMVVVVVSLTSTASAQVGACCLPDLTCVDDSGGFACLLAGGTFYDGMVCADVTCEPPPVFGACCYEDGSCFDFVEEGFCIADGGTPSPNQECFDIVCELPTTGACCFIHMGNTFCSLVTATQCALSNGVYSGDDTSCPPMCPGGACCLPDGTCVEVLDGADCGAQGGAYEGDGTACESTQCPVPGACCLGDGACAFEYDDDCLAMGGLHQGMGSDCGSVTCPSGACCDRDGTCDVQFETVCEAADGNYQGHGTTCAVECAPVLVKSQTKISNAVGGYTGGEPLYTVASIGDIDGDGIGDIMVGHPFIDGGGDRRGAVTILFLNMDGSVKGERFLSGGIGIPAQPDDANFGRAIAPLGDLDGNGTPDVAVAAPGELSEPVPPVIWVLLLQPSGIPIAQIAIGDGQGGFSGAIVSAGFGWTMANVGDLDDDGNDDLAVGASNTDGTGNSLGAVWILHLNSNGTVKTQHRIDEAEVPGGLFDAQHFGSVVAGLGDVNGDGVGDLAVVDLLFLSSVRRVSVIMLNADGTLQSHQPLANSEPLSGESLAGIGDHDGNGVPDLAVGAHTDSDWTPQAGAVWLFMLNADGTLGDELKISDTAGHFTGDLDQNDWFGTSLTCLGDHDGDGVVDLAVNAQLDDDGGMNLGAEWIMFLEPLEDPCPADLDNSGGVDVNDLVDVIVQWGVCPGCPADIDGDGDVDVDDLVAVVTAWGSCS